jgi:peptide/nickel transport system substrate-binding protein
VRPMRRLALLLGLVVALVGCDGHREALHRRRDPGALVVAQAADIQGLDLLRVTDNESLEIAGLMFEGLLRWKPGTTEIDAGLAESFELLEGNTKWVFHLRPNVVFHDGTPFDAASVKFSFDRLLEPTHPNYLAGEDGAYWRTLLSAIKTVTVVDASTVAIEVTRPYAPLAGEVALFPIVSPTAVKQWGDQFQRHPVGTGPFVFESWSPGEQVVVRRFDRYWGKPARLDQIVFRVVVDARQRLVELESGSVDLANAIMPDEQPFVELHPDLELHHTQGNDVSYLAMNMMHEPFDDIRIRRAINLGINKEPIVKLAYQGRAVAAEGVLPPTQWGYHQPKTRYAYDLAAARKLVAEVVAEKHLDPNHLYKFYSLSTPRPYMAQPERVARFLAANLEQIGIHTEITFQPLTEHRIAVERGEHDLALFGWIGDTGDPDNFLYVLFHTNAVGEGQPQNYAFYSDPGVDKLLIDAQSASDEATRTGMYRVIQDRISDAAPWVPIAHSELVVAGRTELRDVVLSPLGYPVYALIRRAEVQ